MFKSACYIAKKIISRENAIKLGFISTSTICTTAATLSAPFLFGNIVAQGGTFLGHEISLSTAVPLFLSAFFVIHSLPFVRNLFSNPVIGKLTYDTMKRLEHQLLYKPYAYQISAPLGDKQNMLAIARIATQDLYKEALQQAFPSVIELLAASTLLTASYSWKIGIWILSMTGFSAGYNWLTGDIIGRAQKVLLNKRMAAGRHITGILSKFENLYYCNSLEYEKAQVQHYVGEAQEADHYSSQLQDLIMLGHTVGICALLCGPIILIAHEATSGDYSRGELSTVLFFIIQAIIPLHKLGQSASKIKASSVEFASLMSTLTEDLTPKSGLPSLKLGNDPVKIEFRHVNFSYKSNQPLIGFTQAILLSPRDTVPDLIADGFIILQKNAPYIRAYWQVSDGVLSRNLDFSTRVDILSYFSHLTQMCEDSEFVSEITNLFDCAPALSDVSFVVPAGKTVAIVGESGSGKSTITKLLFRLYELDSKQGGGIYFNDQVISELTVSSVRECLAAVPQNPVLFTDTIRDNIAYGALSQPDNNENILDERIKFAVEQAGLKDFVDSLPDGLDTSVGENSLMVSGGQLLRVAIARALIRRSPIMILDEYTSALDAKTEALIQNNVKRSLKDKTVIIIAHRLATIMDADHIIYMEHGRITEHGTFEELIRRNNKFARMWKTQLKQQAHEKIDEPLVNPEEEKEFFPPEPDSSSSSDMDLEQKVERANSPAESKKAYVFHKYDIRNAFRIRMPFFEAQAAKHIPIANRPGKVPQQENEKTRLLDAPHH